MREATCAECGRVFDLLDDDDASEWAYGHDCEPMTAVDKLTIQLADAILLIRD